MSYMKTVCGWVKSYIENSFSVIYQLFNFFFICCLGNQSSCH